MDFDFSIWIALLAIYLLQFLLSKKKPAGQQSPQPVLENDAPPSSLNDALSEISRMLSGEAPTPQRKQPLPSPKAIEPLPRKAVYYDEAIEKKDYKSFHAPVITHPKKNASVVEAPLLKPVRHSMTQDVKQDIRVRAKAQEALILAELLGPPLSLKRRSRGR